MPSVPYPLTGTTYDELKTQLYNILRDLYEEKIGGAELGDVFGVSGDVLTLVLNPTSSGLTKTDNQLAINCNPAGGLTANANGLFVKVDGTSLVADANGLRVGQSAHITNPSYDLNDVTDKVILILALLEARGLMATS